MKRRVRRKLFILFTIFSASSLFAMVGSINQLVIELRFRDILIVDANGRPRSLTPAEERWRKLEPLLYSLGSDMPPAIWMYLVARRLRSSHVRRRRLQSHLCGACGYDLTGNTSGA